MVIDIKARANMDFVRNSLPRLAYPAIVPSRAFSNRQAIELTYNYT